MAWRRSTSELPAGEPARIPEEARDVTWRRLRRMFSARATRANVLATVLTVALGVFRSQTPAGSPDWAGLMAATLVAAVPVLILFFAFARKIIDSIGYSGSK